MTISSSTSSRRRRRRSRVSALSRHTTPAGNARRRRLRAISQRKWILVASLALGCAGPAVSACGGSNQASIQTEASASTITNGLTASKYCKAISSLASTSGPSASLPSLTPHSKKAWSFVSAPDLHPMKVVVKTPDPSATPDEILLTPYAQGSPVGQNGALILDNGGNPVWFDPLNNLLQFNLGLRVQTYQHQPVLTFWHGVVAGSPGNRNLPTPDPEPGGCFEIYNDHYRLLKTVTAVDGWSADQHDFVITPQGDAIFTVFKLVPMDLTKYGGPSQGRVGDTGVQEINLATGKLIFSWDMLQHVNLSASEYPASYAMDKASNNVWDAFHMNSLDVGPNNQLLISGRNLWTIYDVDMRTGKILWQLGGKHSTFTFPKTDATFSWQHMVEFQPGGQISMFDDGCCADPRKPAPQSQSHGLLLRLDLQNKTATEVKSYYHNPGLQASSEGGYQALPHGDALISWGSQPYYSQYDSTGNTKGDGAKGLVYDVMLPGKERTYRTFRQAWTGTPYFPPSAAARFQGSGTDVYASWNGSTQTAAWRVLGGPSNDSLKVLAARASRTGFETDIHVQSGGPYFEVQALDSSGKVLGTSKVVVSLPGRGLVIWLVAGGLAIIVLIAAVIFLARHRRRRRSAGRISP